MLKLCLYDAWVSAHCCCTQFNLIWIPFKIHLKTQYDSWIEADNICTVYANDNNKRMLVGVECNAIKKENMMEQIIQKKNLWKINGATIIDLFIILYNYFFFSWIVLLWNGKNLKCLN